MTYYSTQSHYPDTEPPSSCPVECPAKKREVSILNHCFNLMSIQIHEVWIAQFPKMVAKHIWLMRPFRLVTESGFDWWFCYAVSAENCLFFIQTGHSDSFSRHNQFVLIDTYEIKILDIKMTNCYFSIKFYDWTWIDWTWIYIIIDQFSARY